MCNFSDMTLKNGQFANCLMRECHFTNAKLVGANFKNANLQGSIFHNTDLTKADFRDAINYGINPLTNVLKKAQFSQPEVLSLLKYLEISIS